MKSGPKPHAMVFLCEAKWFCLNEISAKSREQCAAALEALNVLWIVLLAIEIFDKQPVDFTMKCSILYSFPWKHEFLRVSSVFFGQTI